MERVDFSPDSTVEIYDTVYDVGYGGRELNMWSELKLGEAGYNSYKGVSISMGVMRASVISDLYM